MDVEVHPGNETAGIYSHNRLWKLLDQLPVKCKPALVRGDIGYGNDSTMTGCEIRNQKFLFKLRQSKNIKKLIASFETSGNNWIDAGEGWQGIETEAKLSTWERKRRIIILRRYHSKNKTMLELLEDTDQRELPLIYDDEPDNGKYEYQVLITNTSYEILALAQLYRDRADCENNFDELKNQWGWGGFNAQNITRTKTMARLVGLIYNWWNIFCRLAEPNKHMEAKTSRPLLQNIIGRISKSGGYRIVYLSPIGKQSEKILHKLNKVSEFISSIHSTATQLSKKEKWGLILREAFKKFFPSEDVKAMSEGQQLLLDF